MSCQAIGQAISKNNMIIIIPCHRILSIDNKLKGFSANINRKKVLKLMNIINIHPKIKKRKKYSSYKGNIGKVADNILNRNFKADKLNQKWTTDVSEFKFSLGKCYLNPMLDMFNNEIVGYDLSLSPNYK